MKLIDLTKQRFGKLLVLELSDRKYSKRSIWKCQCDCGNTVEVGSDNLRRGKQVSCGCFRDKELAKMAKEKNKKKPGDASFSRLYESYKHGAKVRNYSFDLSKEEFRVITSSQCFYCGIEPMQEIKSPNKNGEYIYNGIDRVDNSKGYEIGNCVPCCKTCNVAKHAMAQDAFLKWVKRIYINQYVKPTEITPGQLIDLLFTTDYKCWWAQERLLDKSLSAEERADEAKKAQEYNAKRTNLIRTIDMTLGFADSTNTEKTYYTYFKDK
jgi:hypothetical protein